MANASSIERYGFRESSDGYLGRGVYLAHEDKATDFAKLLDRHGGEEGALIQCKVTVDKVMAVSGKTGTCDHAGSDAIYYDGSGSVKRPEMVVRGPHKVKVERIQKLGDTKAREELGKSLWQAARAGGEAAVKRLLREGASTEHREFLAYSGGYTPLIVASYQGHSGTVKLLLDAGANVNAQTDKGGTALIEAAYHNNVEVVRVLCSRGANKHHRKWECGHTAAEFARELGHHAVLRALGQ